MIKNHVIIVGGGASGMIAAIAAKRQGANVTLLERNPRIGKKILATGNGRCNYTNVNADVTCFHGSNPKFVYNALASFDVNATIAFFEKLGIAPKVEALGKVFPMSDQASSFLDVLLYELNDLGIDIVCDAYVIGIKQTTGGFLVELENKKIHKGDKLILATGGLAMPSSGSDGNGFVLAEKFGHTIIETFPGLVQLKLEGPFFKQIDGVKFVGTAEILSGNKSLAQDRGDILFTNYGISGPPILQLSRKAGELLHKKKEAVLKVTIIDSMSKEDLTKLIKERFKNGPRKTAEYSLIGLINKRLIPVVLKEAGLRDLKTPVAELSKQEQEKIVNILTDWRFKVIGTKSWSNAQVTAGGVNTKEINQSTLESKLIKGLYFTGEILDIDGQCGGFNLQWAWSSGYVAGQNAATSL